jgi:hypothetical protein
MKPYPETIYLSVESTFDESIGAEEEFFVAHEDTNRPAEVGVKKGLGVYKLEKVITVEGIAKVS